VPVAPQRHQVRPAQVLLARGAGGRIPDHDLLQPGEAGQRGLQPGQLVGAVDDGDPGVAVRGHIGDLVRGQRRVERHGDCARVHGGQVREHVLQPVGQEQGDALARGQAEPGQARGQLEHALPGVGPGQRLPGGVGGVTVGVRRGGPLALGHLLEQIADRLPGDALFHLAPQPQHL
jgi:hypothetical protein